MTPAPVPSNNINAVKMKMMLAKSIILNILIAGLQCLGVLSMMNTTNVINSDDW